MDRRSIVPSSWRDTSASRRSVVVGIAAVGAFLAADLGAVLYARGPLGSQHRLTPQAFIDAFRAVTGVHPGYRLNHAKGVAVSGYFDSNGAGAEVSRAAVFRAGRTPLLGRFSVPGGNPTVSDTAAGPRGLGLAIGYPGAGQWRTAMLNLPVFQDNSVQGFYDRLLASKPLPDTGKPDPAAMTRFLAAHPETARAMSVIKQQPPTSGFADSTFRGLNAFYFVGTAGDRTPVRWSLAPLREVTPPPTSSISPNWLFDNVVRDIRSAPLRWRLIVTIGEPDDDVRDATIAWPPDRRTIDTGTVVLDSIATESAGNARDVNFDPMVLPDGIEPSEDPLLPARSAVYAASFRRRAGVSGAAPQVQADEVAR
ncbi:catalase family peroxidase [Mycolicibacterium neworleansense]|uniref:Catalase-related peroxidase n=1 Tax=Mycolicibacterium neworleansense TaxID=146018 RepID=A0A0H5S7S6_9MYCO|nr:catalase family peroxidase [Mycolicibacterium neworleansense]MCV7360103.1 catalase family peroxidase [Mycolicibacterium neworleansense]CRZ17294.1 catalase [Mycolicibacterium neworleansense]